MSEILKIMSLIFGTLGFVQIPLMLLADSKTGNYWADIWDKTGSMEPRAGSIYILFILSFVCVCIKELVDANSKKKSKKVGKKS